MENKRKITPFSKWFEALEKIELFLAGLALAILFIVVMIGIIAHIAGKQAIWTEEATRVFFLFMMWIGVGAGFNHAESARVTVFVNSMPKAVQKLCHALYYIICIALFVVMIVVGFQLAMQQMQMNEMGSAFKIPMWIVGLTVPIGSIFALIGVIHTLVSEPYLLKTTAEQLEADEYAAKAHEQFDFSEEGGDKE